MDMRFVPAWIAYGHTFSNVEESDQAMAAYRNAIRLQPGSHLGQLFMGMEHIHSGNLLLAFDFITKSQHICPFDPLVYNELGVIAYKMKRYGEALKYFQQAMRYSPSTVDSNEHWEFPIFNYANTLRKLKRYSEVPLCLCRLCLCPSLRRFRLPHALPAPVPHALRPLAPVPQPPHPSPAPFPPCPHPSSCPSSYPDAPHAPPQVAPSAPVHMAFGERA